MIFVHIWAWEAPGNAEFHSRIVPSSGFFGHTLSYAIPGLMKRIITSDKMWVWDMNMQEQLIWMGCETEK